MKRSMILAALAAALLSACAAPGQMRSEVTRFHQLPASGGPVAIVAADAGKSGDPAFGDYARIVGARLSAAGFPPVAGGAPDFIAQLDYSQQPVAADDDDGGPRIGIGFGSESYGRHGAVGVGFGTSFPIGGRDRDQIAMRTVTLVIERRADGSRVFEGRARSMGPAANFTRAIPLMIDAIFDNFPGESGRTVTVDAAVTP